jgi:hypothetical protein
MRIVKLVALVLSLALAVTAAQPRPAAADPTGLVLTGLAIGAGYLALRHSQNIEHPWTYRNLDRARHANNVCGFDIYRKWRCEYGPPAY